MVKFRCFQVDYMISPIIIAYYLQLEHKKLQMWMRNLWFLLLSTFAGCKWWFQGKRWCLLMTFLLIKGWWSLYIFMSWQSTIYELVVSDFNAKINLLLAVLLFFSYLVEKITTFTCLNIIIQVDIIYLNHKYHVDLGLVFATLNIANMHPINPYLLSSFSQCLLCKFSWTC